MQKLYCYSCDKFQNVDQFHFYSNFFNNTVKERYIIKDLCRNCIDGDTAYQFNDKGALHYKVFNRFLQRNDIQKICDELSCKENNLVLREEALKILGFRTKYRLHFWAKFGAFNTYFVRRSINDFSRVYAINELEHFKNLMENGFFIKRTTRYEKQITDFEVVPDYIFPNWENGEAYLYREKDSKYKPCASCLELKTLNCFKQSQACQDGYYPLCTNCEKPFWRKYYHDNEDRKNQVKSQVKQWRKDNPEYNRKIRNEYRKSNPKMIIKNSIRSRMQSVFNYMFEKYSKEDYYSLYKQSQEVGCTFRELKEWIESQFDEGMTWDNHGVGYERDTKGKAKRDKNGDVIKTKEWHIDHIKPVASFDLSDPEEVKKINHYTNLQPMWADENIKKGSS